VWRKEADGLDWTHLSPAAEIGPGERTGNYRTTGDQLLIDGAGKSFISFDDYAVAVVDELERPKHIGRHASRESPRREALPPAGLSAGSPPAPTARTRR
jgi:putative NADH-flavin reductase